MRDAILATALVLAASAPARAQPGAPPPTDAEVAAAVAPARVEAIARELDALTARLGAERDPAARMRARGRVLEIAAALADDLAEASQRSIALPDAAIRSVERATGHPAREARWAIEDCLAEVARTHVIGESGRACLAHRQLPYGLPLPRWDRVHAEGSEDESAARWRAAEGALVARPGDRDARIALASMQIATRDVEGARATLGSIASDPDARSLLAIARAIEGDVGGAIRELARLVAEDPPHRAIAAFQLGRFVELERPRAQGEPALHGYLVFLCHATEASVGDHPVGLHWMRTAATAGAYAQAGFARPVLSLDLLAPMTSGYPMAGAPRWTCAQVDQRARRALSSVQ